MRKCHACHHELSPESLAAARCVECGAMVRSVARRTVEDKGGVLPHTPIESGESVDLEIMDSSILETYEIGPPPSSEKVSATGKESGPQRKSPTIADRANATIEFDGPGDDAPPASEDGDAPRPGVKKPGRRSTQPLLSDKTVDFSISPAEAQHISLQWEGAVARGSRQGQTIRQKETVTGFRSSLPVKSRHIKSRGTGSAQLAPKSPGEVPDYELLDIIGEGGMGVVYAAHQSSIARTVAVKMLKPSAKVGEEQRDKFISEAVVTGELDHPNIVPIYDLGANDEGALFYSMKRVRGTPWDKVIDKKRLDENLNILLRVADAVAFAHAGGVIHRDLKPENVMLGDYGEVLVMDWGLARITPEFAHADAVFQADSLGGTPAYMSPEMARGPIEKINKTSDIYLLGAILYEIIGGYPPHSGKDVMQCLMAASQNKIDPIRYEGELKEIALKAMATAQEDRYPTVKEFQEAIRVYQSHSESLVLTAHASQNLQKARASGDYALYARALYGFQESLALWDKNERARTQLAETQVDYATCALEKDDLDLAASLLDPANGEQDPLRERIERARADRDARARRLRFARRAVIGLVALVLATVSIAFFNVRAARNVAELARDKEEEARKEADVKRDEALDAQAKEKLAADEAIRQANLANQEKENALEQERIANAQRAIAETAKEAEEYEAYVAGIGLAAAKIDENAFDYAAELLDASEPKRRNWEWGRLAFLCGLSEASYQNTGPVNAVVYSPDGASFASADWSGKVTLRDASGETKWQKAHGQYVMSVAFSPDGRTLASASSNGTIKLYRTADGEEIATLRGHSDGVLSVRFSPDGKHLVSGSYDQTARVWDVESASLAQTLVAHSWWVWAAEFSPDGKRIVTGGQDGKAIVWQVESAFPPESAARLADGRPPDRETTLADPYRPLTQFEGHDGAVYCVRFSPRGDRVATGGYDKRVMLWNPDEVVPVDLRARINGLPEPESKHRSLAGHARAVRAVSFSPDGVLVASAGEDNAIRIWDVDEGTTLKTLRGHGSAVRSCDFSPDGKLLLSASQDEMIRLWNLAGYQEKRLLDAQVLRGHEDAILSARYSQDGKTIITASRDRSARLWDAATGDLVREFIEGHEFLATSAAFFADARRLATGAGDNSVRIWDMGTGTQESVLTPTGRIGSLAISPDGNWIVTGSPSTDATLWDAESGQAVAALEGHVEEVSAIAFSPDGERLITGDERGRLRVWHRGASRPDGNDAPASPWKFERELAGHNGAITVIRFSPDGSQAVTASGDHSCAQWDLATGAELRDRILRHPDWVSALDLSPDGTLAVTTCDDGKARLWRLADGAELAMVEAPGEVFNAVDFSPDGRRAVVTSSAARKIYLWDLATGGGAPLALFADIGAQQGLIWATMFAPDGQHLLTLGGNDAKLWSIESRDVAKTFSAHGAVAGAALSSDGRLLATGSWDHSAKLWDAATGQALAKLDGEHTDYINSVEFSTDDAELLTASDDETAMLWDVEGRKATGIVFRGHTERVAAATFSPDGTQVLTVSDDKTARLWDRATGRETRKLEGHAWAVLCGRFSPNGKRIITGSEDKTAKIWDAETGEVLQTLSGHTAAITAVAFSHDGTRVLTGSQDDTVKLWDPESGKEILALAEHTQEVSAVDFAPDGLHVLSASRDGTATIWPANAWRPKQDSP